MPSSEYKQWMAFANIEPIGDARLDWLFATLAVRLRAMWMSIGSKAENPLDFIPCWEDPGKKHIKKEQTPDQLKQAAQVVTAMFRGAEVGK